jgi:hypothetical protein
MQTVTKSEFKSIHSSGSIGLVASCFKKDKELLSSKLTEIIQSVSFGGSIPVRPVSKVDLGNQGDYMKTAVYTEVIKPSSMHQQPVTLYYVESIIDNSKCSTCSWDDIETNTLVYANC